MIHDHDRSGWFGASDTAAIMGRWDTKTFRSFWLQKLGVNRDHFSTLEMDTGSAYEHRILEYIGIRKMDRQIKIRRLRLRVNLDGEDAQEISEVKTHKGESFKVSRAYWMQAQVEMFAAKKALRIVAYHLEPEDYRNWFREIEDDRLSYLSEEEIKEICKDALYQKIREDMRNLNVNDIIANISNAEVEAMVDTYVGEDNFCKKEIPHKVREVIEKLSSYTIFRKADVWERKNSIAYDIMQEECRASRPLIKARVEQIINEYKFPQLERDEIMYTIADVLTDRLLPEKEEK